MYILTAPTGLGSIRWALLGWAVLADREKDVKLPTLGRDSAAAATERSALCAERPTLLPEHPNSSFPYLFYLTTHARGVQ